MKKIIRAVKKAMGLGKRKKTQDKLSQAYSIPRDQHAISRKFLSQNALNVLYKLYEAGYESYLVGGSVRDLLLGREPKDFDIATEAKPEQVRKLFRNCRLIGRRFRLAHIYSRDEIVEVATFRAGLAQTTDQDGLSEHGMLLDDNIYGSLEEDVWRRDFTINALYYNIADFSVIDYTGGMDDIKNNIIRMIGNPEERYREDPVRMLRAIRFAAKLSFKLDEQTEEPLMRLGYLLLHISNARLFDEVVKLFHSGYATKSFTLLRHYGLFSFLFPQTDACLNDPELHLIVDKLLLQTLTNTDERIALQKPVTPAFLFAAALWYPTLQQAKLYQNEGLKSMDAIHQATDAVLKKQAENTAIPRRFVGTLYEIFSLQELLTNPQGKRPLRLLSHGKFRAAYDFLLMRAAAEPELQSVADWWTYFQSAPIEEQQALMAKLTKKPKKRRKRKKSNANKPNQNIHQSGE